MAIRLKQTEYCSVWDNTSQGGQECVYWETQESPIREWYIPIFSLKTDYTRGGTVPASKSFHIVFPELWLWNERQSSDVVFGFEVSYGGMHQGWLTAYSSEANGTMFKTVNPASGNLSIGFQNLLGLPAGTHTASVRLKAFWRKNGETIFIENAPQTIDISLRVLETSSDTPNNLHDGGTLNITYNKTMGELSGEREITIINTNVRPQDVPEFVDLARGNAGYTMKANTRTQKLSAGVHSGVLSLSYGSELWVYTIRLVVVESAGVQDFFLSTESIRLHLPKESASGQTGTVEIINPHHLSIDVLLKPSFIASAVIENNVLKFETLTPSSLTVGDYSGEIILQSGSLRHSVAVVLKVSASLVSEFRGEAYYFALDNRKITVSKSVPNASFVRLSLEMTFQGFGELFRENEHYDYSYFGDSVELMPGEEVQDFFVRISELKSLEPQAYQFGMAVVNMSIKEYDVDAVMLGEVRLENLFFAPGKKPKCFPIYTDFAKRRTFCRSNIRLSTDVLSNHLAALPNLDISVSSAKMEVHSFTFERNRLGGEKAVVEHQGVRFVPFPEPPRGRVIDVFFETDNLVLDWFSCLGDYERKSDFSHITHETTGEKYASVQTESITLHTGWILREEIELVNALIKSRVCFIKIDDEILKAYPTSKKNEAFDTAENLYSLDLEFRVGANG